MTEWQYGMKPPENVMSAQKPKTIMTDADITRTEARIRARAKGLVKQWITLCGCPIEELSREALLDGMHIACDAIKRERKVYMMDREMLKAFAEADDDGTVVLCDGNIHKGQVSEAANVDKPRD